MADPIPTAVVPVNNGVGNFPGGTPLATPANPSGGGNTSNFSIPITTAPTTTDVNNAMTNPVSNQDLQDAIAGNKNLQASIVANSTPNQAENDLTTKINAIKANEATLQNNLDQYTHNLPGEGISAGAIAGRSGAMANDVNLQLKSMADQETALATELGVATKTRTDQLAANQASYSINKDTISTWNTMQAAIDTMQNQAITERDALDTQARANLDTILTNLKGTAFTALDPSSKAMIQDLGTKLGIPISAIQAGMDANAKQTQLDNLQKAATLANTQATTAKTNADILAISNVNGTGLNSTQVSQLQTLTEKINGDKQTIALQNVLDGKNIINGFTGATTSSDQAAVLMSFVQSLQPGATSVRSAIGPITAMLGSTGAQQLLKAEQIVNNNGKIPSNVISGIVATVNSVANSRAASYKTYITNNYINPNVKDLGIPDLATRLDSIINPTNASAPAKGDKQSYNGANYTFDGNQCVKSK